MSEHEPRKKDIDDLDGNYCEPNVFFGADRVLSAAQSKLKKNDNARKEKQWRGRSCYAVYGLEKCVGKRFKDSQTLIQRHLSDEPVTLRPCAGISKQAAIRGKAVFYGGRPARVSL